MINIGLIKLHLFLHGVQPVQGFGKDFILVLPENTWAAVSPNPNSPYRVKKSGHEYFLEFDDRRLSVKPLLPPPANHQKTASGHRVGELLHSHGGFIAARPPRRRRVADSRV